MMMFVEDLELLERERELGVLSALIAAASRGTGQLVVVEGAAGIGKTRLLAAARAVAEQDGLRVLGARGSELEREFAYGVVRQLFEPALAGAGLAARTELLAGAAGQAAVLFGHVDAAAAPSMGGDVSFATLHGLFWLTADLCARRPLMLVVDDLHWADVPSLRFLAYLLSRLEGLPLVALVGLRPAEPIANQHLLTQITTDPLATVVRPAPLSQAASARLVRTVLTEDAEEEFCLACHTASRGNPLLLRELVEVALAEGLDATAAEVARLTEIGPRAVMQRVVLRLARLGRPAAALCAAVAILGDGADPRYVATLAGLKPEQALQTARQLVDIAILYHRAPPQHEAAHLFGMLGFVHPLVRDAVYEGLSEIERLTGHARAARLLSEGGKAAEQVAAHLLRVQPAADSFVVATLRRAADEAFARGSPESAVSALERCLQEPPADTDRADILFQLGTAAQLVDMVKGADYLTAAMAATNDPEQKATIAEMLGITLHQCARDDEAAQILSQAIHILGDEYVDLRRRLEAWLIGVAVAHPALQESAAQHVSRLWDVSLESDLGSQMLDVAIAFYDALAGQPAEIAVARARRGLVEGLLIEQAHVAAVYGFMVFTAADADDAMSLLDAWVAAAHQHGSLLVYGPAKGFRGLAWLSRGALAEAEMDMRDSMWTAETASENIGRPIVGSYLADVLMEQGRLDEAAAVLDWACMSDLVPSTGYWFWYLDSRARLLMLQGQVKEGLETMLACGRRFTAHGGQNPAIVAWRSGAALALFSLGRPEEARALAAEELTLARRWGVPRALGRALRVAGLVQGGGEGLELLRQAVEVLASSPARLEHAKALVELGAALRRLGQRLESRQYLRRGTELAQICGATPLAKRGCTELRASGARPRHIAPSGLDALTPSERRVAELATAGHSNRDIAQALFITTNTVEVHLTRTYRKLGITGRASLAPHFNKP
jgi:DNA-binding CsgD family transcriptional regulator